jgi:hypothetical protein
MGVSLGHPRGATAKQSFHSIEVYPLHHQPTRSRVPEREERCILNAETLEQPWRVDAEFLPIHASEYLIAGALCGSVAKSRKARSFQGNTPMQNRIDERVV